MRTVDGIYEIDIIIDGSVTTLFLSDDDLDVIYELAENHAI